MHLNTHIDQYLSVHLRGKEYPVTVSGTGIPILSIGLGQLGQRTLSERFKKTFKVYASNIYWDARYALDNPEKLTLDLIVDDIAELGHQLQLPRYFIFAHSAYGIVALEFAKKYPDLVQGIIMSGTPPNSNAEVAAINNDYFEQHAEPHRKIIDEQRRTEYAQQDATHLNTSERFLRHYIWRDAARYWHNPNFDCSPVWEGIIIDDVIDHFFSGILPKIDVRHNLEKVSCPIFLAAGASDYDCCPFLWKKVSNLPKKMVISDFMHSGHWPHYEEQQLFDERVEEWIRNY